MKLLIVLICFLGIIGCSNRSKVFTEKRVIIASKEKIDIKELDMSIINNGCGRKWIVEDDKPATEKAYCDLVVKVRDSVYRFGDSFSPLYINNIKLEINKMNPWGVTEDSVPPGGCRMIISKLEGTPR